MLIQLFNNGSDKNHITKTLTNETTVTGNLRKSVDIIEPILELNFPNIINFNYCYIPDFKRYYYITKITALTSKLFEIQLFVDVLMTYKNKILEQTATIARQEKLFNLYLPDSDFKTYNNSKVVTKKFPTGFDTNDELILILASPSDVTPTTPSKEG